MWVRSLCWEDPLEGGHGSPLQYSCLQNPMDRGAWQAPQGCKEMDMAEVTQYTPSFTIIVSQVSRTHGKCSANTDLKGKVAQIVQASSDLHILEPRLLPG